MAALLPELAQRSSQGQDFSLAAAGENSLGRIVCSTGRNPCRRNSECSPSKEYSVCFQELDRFVQFHNVFLFLFSFSMVTYMLCSDADVLPIQAPGCCPVSPSQYFNGTWCMVFEIV